MIEMTPEVAASLRAEFPPEHVGLLPKLTCRDCTRNQCQNHKKAKCAQCDAWIAPADIHLDFVGHGATTDRLLAVDPSWNWEPMSYGPDGLPLFAYDEQMNPTSLWIRLTVAGVTRLGVGTCPSGQFDAEKVLIGDALRNAAMRFGVALDLWIKGHAEDDERTTATSDRRSNGRQGPPASDPSNTVPAASKDKVDRILAGIELLDDVDKEKLQGWVQAKKMPEHPRMLTGPQADEVIAHMATLIPEEKVEPFG